MHPFLNQVNPFLVFVIELNLFLKIRAPIFAFWTWSVSKCLNCSGTDYPKLTGLFPFKNLIGVHCEQIFSVTSLFVLKKDHLDNTEKVSEGTKISSLFTSVVVKFDTEDIKRDGWTFCYFFIKISFQQN